MGSITPIVYLDKIHENNVYMKRDDLIPFSFGGNKVRIAMEYFADMEQKGCDCLIGYGNARSNLCRVLANMSSAKGIPCHIVSPSDDDGTRADTANSFLVHACGAKIHTCSKQDVAASVQNVIDLCKAEGHRPYYIYGDKTGSGNEAVPVRAYVKAYDEICAQEKEMQTEFDMIFLATGTGMTQAGLLVGAEQAGKKHEIIGISVARNAAQERAVLEKYMQAYMAEKGVTSFRSEAISVCDEYLCGGYGKYHEGIQDVIRTAFLKYGVQLDPTYSGKGFYGMTQYLQHITGKNILFIHTGGTPLFFDYISKHQ